MGENLIESTKILPCQQNRGRGDTRMNNEIHGSLSRKRMTVVLQYVPAN